MKKGIYSLPALRELLLAVNRRYLQYISSFDDPTSGIRKLHPISKTDVENDRPYKGFTLFSDDDQCILESIAAGEFNISGRRLWPQPLSPLPTQTAPGQEDHSAFPSAGAAGRRFLPGQP